MLLGKKDIHTMVSNMLEAIPEPRPENCVNLVDIKSKSDIHLYVSICLFISPYPFYRSSSSSSTMRPVMKNWMMIDPMSNVTALGSGVPAHAGENIHDSLAHSNHHLEEILSAIK